MTIELAPHNKHSLTLAAPLLAGSGAVGYADAWPPGVTATMFGAIVTPPVSWRPRRGHPPGRLAETPAGFILAADDHNPGFRRVLDDHLSDWRRLTVPIIMALAGSAVEDWDRIAAHVEDEPAIAGLELHVAEGVRPVDVANWVGAVRRATTLPLLVKLPSAQAPALAPPAVQAGADALVIGAAPLAAGLTAAGSRGVHDRIEGPLAGPAVFPVTLRAVAAVVASTTAGLGLPAPIIAAGGIGRLADVELCFDAGAVAVQIRSLLWVDPATAVQLAAGLTGR
jgi:dihydroorotate dehydrogenase (NAD+) catalytic subunit